MVETIKSWKEANEDKKIQVTICLFEEKHLKQYREVLESSGDILRKDDSVYLKDSGCFHGDLGKYGIET